MEIWTGFILGLLGSLHCAGMCGPIVLAIPWGYDRKFESILKRLLYHTGRIFTYSIIGLVVGYIGGAIAITGYQNVLSITVGTIIIIAFLIPARFKERIITAIGISKIYKQIKKLWGSLFGINSLLSIFVLGILNGFLPCGLVYIALAGAVTTGGSLQGMAYMTAFGLGTAPILLALSFLGNIIGRNARKIIGKLIPVAAVVLAVLFILRGLSLGIPYISPKTMTDSKGATNMECCHPAKPPVENSVESER
ncbi:MAG: sulfite exporter TauE/SafE family protein [candidate division Zixibacteria bacterium]